MVYIVHQRRDDHVLVAWSVLELFDAAAQLHINLGLDKLRETQAGVEDMQKGLAEKERRLRCGAPGKST